MRALVGLISAAMGLFIAALLSLQVPGFPMTVFVFLGASPVVGLLALIAGATSGRPSTVGAGVLTMLSSLALPVWVWFSAFSFWGDEVILLCSRASAEAGFRFTSDYEVVRNYVPPALLCLPEGSGGPVVLGSDLGVAAGFSIALLLIAGGLAAAMVFAVRSARRINPLVTP